MELCFQNGATVVNEIHNIGSNCICFGEMCIGNTSTASVLMTVLTSFSIEECVGKGTGVTNEKLENKIIEFQKMTTGFINKLG